MTSNDQLAAAASDGQPERPVPHYGYPPQRVAEPDTWRTVEGHLMSEAFAIPAFGVSEAVARWELIPDGNGMYWLALRDCEPFFGHPIELDTEPDRTDDDDHARTWVYRFDLWGRPGQRQHRRAVFTLDGDALHDCLWRLTGAAVDLSVGCRTTTNATDLTGPYGFYLPFGVCP